MPEPERESFDICFIHICFTGFFSTFSFLRSSAPCIATLFSEIHLLSLLCNLLLNTNETNASIFCDFSTKSYLSLPVHSFEVQAGSKQPKQIDALFEEHRKFCTTSTLKPANSYASYHR